MSLYSTPYPNPTRTISGVAQIYEDDVVLAVDTTSIACSISLLEIPDNHWNTNWKLYLVPTETVLTHTITIIAGTGQTINGAASVVFAVGPSNKIKISISSNNSYMAEIDSFTAISPIVDSGWVNLLGFDHLTGWNKRPQFRVLGKQLFFRGTIIVPMATDDKGENLAPIGLDGTAGFYADLSFAWVFQGVHGCTLDQGKIFFNKDANVFPAPFNAIAIPDETSFGLKMLTRTTIALVSSTDPVLLHSVGELIITSDNKLVLKSYENLENSNQNVYVSNGDGLGGSHQIITNIRENQYVPNWNFAGGGSVTSSAVTDASPFSREFLVAGDQFTFDMNAALAENLGGFQLILDGFHTFIS